MNSLLEQLPGPDTKTKAEAVRSKDPRYLLMLQEAAEVGWPAAYQQDLYQHDRSKLEEYPEQAILWILRDTGTSVLPLRCESSHWLADYRRHVGWYSGEHKLNYFADEPAETHPRFYVVRSNRMEPVTWQEALQRFTLKETS
jgi:hypothetical protein